MSGAPRTTVRVPLTIRHRPGRRTVVTPVLPDGGAVAAARADPALVKALARAFRYRRLLDDGRYGSISEMAAAEKRERGYLGTLLRLTLLAPEIVEALLDGREQGLSLLRLLEPFPTCWTEQQALFRQITGGQADTLRRGAPRPAGRIERRGTSLRMFRVYKISELPAKLRCAY